MCYDKKARITTPKIETMLGKVARTEKAHIRNSVIATIIGKVHGKTASTGEAQATHSSVTTTTIEKACKRTSGTKVVHNNERMSRTKIRPRENTTGVLSL